MKIHFLNSLAYPSFCVVFVLFLKSAIIFVLHISRGFGWWCDSSV